MPSSTDLERLAAYLGGELSADEADRIRADLADPTTPLGRLAKAARKASEAFSQDEQLTDLAKGLLQSPVPSPCE